MLRPMICIAVLFAMLVSVAPVLAFDCELDPIVRNGKEVGAKVINGLDNYCGSVYRTGGGFRVKLDGRDPEFFNSNYTYRDVLDYMCEYCLFKKKDILSGQQQ